MAVRIINADVFDGLAQLPDNSVHCCVTSPPYWGLRSYLPDGHTSKEMEIGQEPTLSEHIDVLLRVFREVRRVLRKDGTLWLNYGDAYAGSWGAQGRQGETGQMASRSVVSARQIASAQRRESRTGSPDRTPGLKPKDLMMLPARLAIALCDDGWWLRSDIIWHKLNPMPESCRDRPTSAHEHIFLLAKSERYYYDADSVRENRTGDEDANGFRGGSYVHDEPSKRKAVGNKRVKVPGGWDLGEGAHGTVHRDGRTSATYAEAAIKDGRNMHNVLSLATFPYPDAHFATFPPRLAETCIKAGCPAGGVVLDPFGGSGTTGMVADRLARNAILIELHPDYPDMARKRIEDDAPLLAEVDVITVAAA